MKKLTAIIAVLAMVFPLGMAPAFAAPSATSPVIFFSDLTSGPNTGGANNGGVFVTVVGKNFGASRGAGSVSVGGSEASAYPVWTDTKISFQIGSGAKSGDIKVKTSVGDSNGIHFTVRPGRIFFVSASAGSGGDGSYGNPWQSPQSFFNAQQPGDTCYFRNGTYNGRYGSSSRSYNVSFYNTNAPSGSADNEIAWVGYPGETAQFRADDGNASNGAFEFVSDKKYYVIAGLSIYGRGDGREQVRLYTDNVKLVNNKIEGIKSLSYGMVGVTAANIKIWGNEMFGATSGNKLDHIIYFQAGGSIHDVDVGWNYIHDNNIAVGPVFSWNLEGGSAMNTEIHDNKIDCRNSSDALRLAGQWGGADGSTTFTNNLIIGAGAGLNNDDAYNAIYVGFGKAYVYHNTFYKSRGAGSNAVVNAYNNGWAEVKNNIFCNENSIGYVKGNIAADSNLYCGGSGSAPSEDKHAVTSEPQFVNEGSLDLHLRTDSPARDKAANVVSKHTSRDYDGVPRTVGKLAIGALQYFEGGPLPEVSGASGGATVNGENVILPAGQILVLGSAAGRGTVNPAKGDTVKIFFQGSGNGKFACRIFTLTGEMVWDSSQDNVNGGKFEWPAVSMASGIYVANVRGPGLSATKKIAILS